MNPNLRLRADFKKTLANYQISAASRQALQGLKLVLLLAPTSTGKNTIIRRLTKDDKYYFVVSDTTRPPRTNDGVKEQNGNEYWFRKEEDFLTDLQNGQFLEAELIHDQQVSGISIRELLKAKNQQKIAVTDIDLEGLQNVVKAKPDTIAVMLLPPSFEEWQRRIKRRGEMDKQEYARRLKTAEKIFNHGLSNSYYQFLVAEDVANSKKIIDLMVSGGSNPHQKRGRRLVAKLLKELKA